MNAHTGVALHVFALSMKRTLSVVVTLILCTAVDAVAEGKATFSAQLRQRFEADGKDFDSNTGPATLNLLRTRIAGTFTVNENASAFIQLQDSRVFGEEQNTLAPIDNVDIHQSYFLVNNLFARPVDVKIGRMELNLGPQRLIGAVGWSNVGRSFDGVMARVRKERSSFNIFSFTELDSLKRGDFKDRYVHGAFADINRRMDYNAQLFWIWQRWVPSSARDRHTLGVYVAKKGRFRHETEFAFQTGTLTVQGMEQDVSAILAAINLGYGFPDVAGRPDVGMGIDYLSGDDDLADDDFKVFDTMYGTNHKYYGFMDYFVDIPQHTAGAGLVDVHARLAITPGDKTSLKIAVHNFTAAEDFTLADTTQTSTSFGNEVDVTLIYKYDANLSFVAGASAFAPGDIFKDDRFIAVRKAGGEDTSTWFYFMTIFNMR